MAFLGVLQWYDVYMCIFLFHNHESKFFKPAWFLSCTSTITCNAWKASSLDDFYNVVTLLFFNCN
jgi:hypothetical protein